MTNVIQSLPKNGYFDKSRDFVNIHHPKASPMVLFKNGLLYKMCTLLTGKGPQKFFSGHNPFIPLISTLLWYIYHIYAIYDLQKPLLVLYVLFRSPKVRNQNIWCLSSNIYFQAREAIKTRWDTTIQKKSYKRLHENVRQVSVFWLACVIYYI